MMAVGRQPFGTAEFKDLQYRALASKNYKLFWNSILKHSTIEISADF